MKNKIYIKKAILILLIIIIFAISLLYFFLSIGNLKDQKNDNSKPIIETSVLNDSVIDYSPYIDYQYFIELFISQFYNSEINFNSDFYFGYKDNFIYISVYNESDLIYKYKYELNFNND